MPGAMLKHPIETEMASPRVLSRDELRRLDADAVREMGVPSIVLMENAALGACRGVLRLLGGIGGGPVAVLCGTGNNGGDGLALARQLHIRGRRVRVLLTGDPDRLTPDAAANLTALKACRVEAEHLDAADEGGAERAAGDWLARVGPALIVDALLGTGLSREVRGPLRGVIEAINEAGKAGACVVSLDLPSGLDADTGRPLGAAVRAHATMTFAALKRGFFTLEAQGFVGEIELLPIGVPSELTGRYGVVFEDTADAPSRFDPPHGSGETEPTGTGRDAGEPGDLGGRGVGM
ncbi:MAG TPA: NAD(P)H-hydrate epimerase [Phycisphaerales bacterium]|nr:NAD(P)H-hydrate epimerase [Phycisphaerales bacterium]